jgi:hypothetical protein
MLQEGKERSAYCAGHRVPLVLAELQTTPVSTHIPRLPFSPIAHTLGSTCVYSQSTAFGKQKGKRRTPRIDGDRFVFGFLMPFRCALRVWLWAVWLHDYPQASSVPFPCCLLGERNALLGLGHFVGIASEVRATTTSSYFWEGRVREGGIGSGRGGTVQYFRHCHLTRGYGSGGKGGRSRSPGNLT